ncbi:atypical 2-cysteine peroxiredoxin [Heterobasidion irregulare TC 32-1]|uniref:Atypical 2-cysteine peroxiredoxin n=1 Tax=Heterobasidion irregulare (strain TC 32-1) TaxID=747525 RepID=W4JUC3_HETIT|nr:atypical 2-cysteine peroxiredoxin [Heterobasidion irregulare TC 32-1]ETW76481.1 atypical 2-cysteine peroxiredoxin [Heterobasidion irregulare TC 32-1]
MSITSTSLLTKAQVTPGEKIPTLTVKETNPGETITLDLKGKNIIIGVPGAFTPPCSSQVPGYIEKYDEFKAKGVNNIYVVAVNDAFVTKAWKEKLAPNGTSVRFIGDDQGLLVGSLGLLQDATGLLGNPRSKRFAIVADEGAVSSLTIEEDSSTVVSTAADKILAVL